MKALQDWGIDVFLWVLVLVFWVIVTIGAFITYKVVVFRPGVLVP